MVQGSTSDQPGTTLSHCAIITVAASRDITHMLVSRNQTVFKDLVDTHWTGHRGGRGSGRPLVEGNKWSKKDDFFL